MFYLLKLRRKTLFSPSPKVRVILPTEGVVLLLKA